MPIVKLARVLTARALIVPWRNTAPLSLKINALNFTIRMEVAVQKEEKNVSFLNLVMKYTVVKTL